jgi:hypothetical protein
MACANSARIIIIQFIPHSSHSFQQLGFYDFKESMQQFNFALLPKPSDMSLEGTATITPREGK